MHSSSHTVKRAGCWKRRHSLDVRQLVVSLQGSCNEYGSIHPQRVLLQTNDAQGDESYFSLIKWSRCLQYKVQAFLFKCKMLDFADIFTETNRKSSPSELLQINRFNLNQKKICLNWETSIWNNKKSNQIEQLIQVNFLWKCKFQFVECFFYSEDVG